MRTSSPTGRSSRRSLPNLSDPLARAWRARGDGGAMHKLNVLLIALLLAAAAVFGTYAAVRSTSPSSATAAKSKQLDRFEAALRAELRKSTATPAQARQVVVRRAAPVVVTTQHEDEHEGEHEHDEGEDD